MDSGENKVKAFINKTTDFVKKIPVAIAKLATPVGQVIGWILLIILIVILFTVIGQVATKALARLIGISWNYRTYDNDLEIIRQLNVSGYESTIDAENFQNYKAFEYAVLMDAAEYLRNTKQEMFDVNNEKGDYNFERNLLKKNKPEEYNAKIEELSKQYANVGDGIYHNEETNGNEDTSARLMNVNYTTNQSTLSDSNLQAFINAGGSARNVTVTGITETGSILGGTNRVTGPFLVYEFKDGSSDTESGTGKFGITVDESRLGRVPKKVWKNYSSEIIQCAEKFGLDPYFIIAVICCESSGRLNLKNSSGAFGLMQTKAYNYTSSDVDDNPVKMYTGESNLRDSALKQIEAGCLMMKQKIKTHDWNVYEGAGAYAKGDAGWREAENRTRYENHYWNKNPYGVRYYFCGGSETWIIKKEGNKYYKVYTDMTSHNITRTEEITPSANAQNESGESSGDATSQSTTHTSTQNLTAKYNRIIFVGDDRTLQIYYIRNGWNAASEEVDQLDTKNNYWLAKNDAGISWMQDTAINSMQEYIENKTAVVVMLGINDVVSNNASRYVTLLNQKATEWKQENSTVDTFFVSVNPVDSASTHELTNEAIVNWNNEIKNGLSSNVTYIDTYSKIYNNAQFKDWVHYTDQTSNDIYNLIVNAVNEYPETTYDDETFISSGDSYGYLEPYIYVTRENIEFSYYFDANNQVIEYPLLLNAFNAKLNVGSENSAEVNRALLGIAPVVFPDQDVSQYKKTPYYSNKTENIVYKIPLRTILGRYLPKAELLNAWSYIKQNVERDTEDTDTQGIIDYTIEAIKGVYNEACLLGEDVNKVSEAIPPEELTRIDEDTIFYSDEQTHKKSFVTFEKAGIETTKYSLDGLEALDESDGDANIRLVTDFVSAVIVNDEIPVTYKATYVTENVTPMVDELTGETTQIVSAATTTETQEITISAKDLGFHIRKLYLGFRYARRGIYSTNFARRNTMCMRIGRK